MNIAQSAKPLSVFNNSPRRQILQHLFGQDAQVVATLGEALQDDVSQRNIDGDVLDVVEDALEALLDRLDGEDASLLGRLQQLPHGIFCSLIERFECHDYDLSMAKR